MAIKLSALLPVLLALAQLWGAMAQSELSVEGFEVLTPKKGWTQFEQQPEFPGGMKALSVFLRQHIRYPNGAKKAKVKGWVFASFVIDPIGQLAQIQVLKGLGHGCDEEAIRVIALMPCWIPAELNGQKVSVKYYLPILFPKDY